MTLDKDSIGSKNGPVEFQWTERDTLLYAMTVGAGQVPGTELDLTTENSEQVSQEVVPSFAALIAQKVSRPAIGDYDHTKLVHAEQHFELHQPLTPSGHVNVTARVEGIEDKGSGALVRTTTRIVDISTGTPWITSRSASFIRGEGGFCGPRQSSSHWEPPRSTPDHEVKMNVRPEQALLYRLNGDRNPLHSDPQFAMRAGFDAPILHGMCTFGFTCRALVACVTLGRPEKLVAMGGRFTAPVWPGDSLTVHVWRDDTTIWFRVLRQDSQVVIDRGTARLTDSEHTG